MLDVPGVGAEIGRKLGDLARIGLRLGRPIKRFLEARSRDQLHRPRDLADVLDRLAASDEGTGLGHCSTFPRAAARGLTCLSLKLRLEELDGLNQLFFNVRRQLLALDKS